MAKQQFPLHALPPGTPLLQATYVIDAFLGQGGFGITYRAHDPHLDRHVAVKELFLRQNCTRVWLRPPDARAMGEPIEATSEGPEPDFTVVPTAGLTSADLGRARTRFLEEGRKLYALRHPGIVPVYGLFTEYGTAYLVMEHVEGETLRQYFQRQGGKLSVPEVLAIAREAGEALTAVHAAGLVHQDVTPHNLLRRPDGRIVLIDFGAARAAAAAGETHTVIQTAGFSALEQYSRRRTLEAHIDVYGLAATLYYLLTEEAPESPLTRLEGTALKEPRALRTEVPEPVSQALLAGLALYSRDRPPTLTAFLELLERRPTVPPPAVPDAGEPRNPADSARSKVAKAQIAAQPSGASPHPASVRVPTHSPAKSEPASERVARKRRRDSGGDWWPGWPPEELTRRKPRWPWAFLAFCLTVGIGSGVYLWPKPKQSPGQGKRAGAPATTAVRPGAAQSHRAGELRINPKDGAKMVWMPPGECLRGMGKAEIDALWKRFGWSSEWKQYSTDESPEHRVQLSRGYWLYQTEVTNAQYRRFVTATGHREPKYSPDAGKTWKRAWADPEFNAADHPVVGVSWEDAAAYCAWAGARLPTEAEWEYAARGGHTGLNDQTRQVFWWGNDLLRAGERVGNVADESVKRSPYYTKDMEIFIGHDDGYAYTSPVGSYPANGYGLYDMVGNVLEWCADWYQEEFYKTLGKVAVDPVGPAKSTVRVERGGSWLSSQAAFRVSSRAGDEPGAREVFVGFRPARTR